MQNKKQKKASCANLCMIVSIFSVDMSTSKIDDFFTSVGLISPVKSKACENYQKLKQFVMDLSEIKSRKNRIDYCSVVRSMKSYSGNLMVEK